VAFKVASSAMLVEHLKRMEKTRSRYNYKISE